MPTAKINDINIYYESHGTGFPLVFAYGIGGNTTEWELQIPVFSQSYRFIVWDPRGHAQSESPPNADQYTQEVFAQDLEGLLDYLGIDQAYVGGLSMGGGYRHPIYNPSPGACGSPVDLRLILGVGVRNTTREPPDAGRDYPLNRDRGYVGGGGIRYEKQPQH